MLFSSSTRDKVADKVSDKVSDYSDDTAKILADLSSLRDRVAKIGMAKASDLTDTVSDTMHTFTDTVSDRASDLTDEAGEYLKTFDGSLRSNPYMYLLGAVALGLAAGLVVPGLLRGEG